VARFKKNQNETIRQLDLFFKAGDGWKAYKDNVLMALDGTRGRRLSRHKPCLKGGIQSKSDLHRHRCILYFGQTLYSPTLKPI
jgi:hypothetical protein